MKQPDTRPRLFVALWGDDASRVVCTALVLAMLAVWFRIVSIW
jgi:hypothetical protein